MIYVGAWVQANVISGMNGGVLLSMLSEMRDVRDEAEKENTQSTLGFLRRGREMQICVSRSDIRTISYRIHQGLSRLKSNKWRDLKQTPMIDQPRNNMKKVQHLLT
ncbi:hypothetical protein NX059_011444 [Plenodomus lindquistii]|nr:hypothetical protein NX059_011444 [Plenodomus lindquistii]